MVDDDGRSRQNKCSHRLLLFIAELTQEEAYDIFKKCVKEIQKRLIVNLPTFKVAVVDKNGVRYLDEITKESLGSYNPSG